MHRSSDEIRLCPGAAQRWRTCPTGQGDAVTTLPDRPNTALLVIDVQQGVVAGAHERDAVVANIATLVDRARDGHVPVVWVQHSSEQLARGSAAWQYVPELPRLDSEPQVHTP